MHGYEIFNIALIKQIAAGKKWLNGVNAI